MRRLEPVSLPVDLERKVLARINQEQRWRVKVRLFAFGLVDTLALVGLVASLVYLAEVFALSGFGQYLSLIFSDGGFILSNSQELALSLAESLPVLGFVLILLALGVLIWSISKTIINTKTILLYE